MSEFAGTRFFIYKGGKTRLTKLRHGEVVKVIEWATPYIWIFKTLNGRIGFLNSESLHYIGTYDKPKDPRSV